jgi:hypothetical protein
VAPRRSATGAKEQRTAPVPRLHQPVCLWCQRPIGFRLSKRALDLAVAMPLLLLTLPIQAVIALVIHWDSPGPAFSASSASRSTRDPLASASFARCTWMLASDFRSSTITARWLPAEGRSP